MIVIKFGGTSLADADRIGAAGGILAGRLEKRPLVVVSALAGVTDLLEKALDEALRGDLDRLDPLLADLERRHRWTFAAVESSGRRHDLGLEIDRLLEDLRQHLRSIRILGEGTPRARDSVMAFGERLSSRIVAAAFEDRALPARWVDARETMLTDGRFGEARPRHDEIRRAAARHLQPLLDEGVVPVLAGFIGSNERGETTTLGRGGSDTSAAILGAALDASEIQIWTDVDGLMSADPGLVPGARTLPRVSFAEASELALYGARVLHPASVVPAVERGIPVRVLNSMRPEAQGTLVLDGEGDDAAAPSVSLASRSGLWSVAIYRKGPIPGRGWLAAVLAALDERAVGVSMATAGEAGASLLVDRAVAVEELEGLVPGRASIRIAGRRAVLCVVGSALERDARLRAEVLGALGEWEPESLCGGASPISILAAFAEERLAPAVRELHGRFAAQAKGAA